MTVTNSTYGNIFQGITTDWGFGTSDIWMSGMGVIGSLAPFILLGVVIYYVPTMISLVNTAIYYKQSTGKSLTAREWVEEFGATHAERVYKRRKRKGRH